MKQSICLMFASASVLFLASCGQETQQDKIQEYVIAKVKSKDPAFRVAGVKELKAFTKNRAKAISLLKGALGDPNEKVRAAALETLLVYEDEAEPCLGKVRAMALADADQEVRCQAIDTLAQLAKEDDQTIEVLKESIGDKDLTVAVRAASFLLEYGDRAAGSSAAIAELISKGIDKAIADRDTEITGIDLACGLAELRQKASGAIPVLQKASKKPKLSSKVKKVLTTTVSAIRNGSGSSGVSKLLKGLFVGIGSPGESPEDGSAPPPEIVAPPPDVGPPPTDTGAAPPPGAEVPPPEEVPPPPTDEEPEPETGPPPRPEE